MNFRAFARRTAAVSLTAAALALAGPLTTGASAAVGTPAVACPSSACKAAATGLGDPTRIATDSLGHDYQTFRDGRVVEVTTATGAVRTVAQGLGNLRGVAADGTGHLYTGDFDGNITKVDLATGGTTRIASGVGAAQGLAYGNGAVYVVGNAGKLFEVREGQPVRTVASGIGYSQSVALDGKGSAYTGDMFTRRILRVNISSGAVTTVATDAYEPDSLSYGPDGRVYFTVGSDVHRYDPASGAHTVAARLNGLYTFTLTLDRQGVAQAVSSGQNGSVWQVEGLTRL
ncbi:hypothetical protein KUM39_05925 [Streptomyces sp. J2-1]|uniref:Vgb family protein n=1 Tax=Streptomyces corallincola TaxID=2851888 RepID=UPI001C38854F|nr:hypothetical protein [Streptomyces corallincola]MBV2353900.1 hypothetical protein [Streptomyces corallincola]